MKTLALLTSLFIITSFTPPKKATLTADEKKLYQLIMQYRKSKKLPSIPLSNALTQVAQTHAQDLAKNNPNKKPKCNMHSWSNSDQWSGCCYTNNHAKASCMWDKPRELTTYPGNGYEIAAQSTILSPQEALNLWKKSTGHNNVIINKDIWKKVQWKSIGIGINGQYATVWFGKEDDPEGPPKQ